jgi:hypothetical protein
MRARPLAAVHGPHVRGAAPEAAGVPAGPGAVARPRGGLEGRWGSGRGPTWPCRRSGQGPGREGPWLWQQLVSKQGTEQPAPRALWACEWGLGGRSCACALCSLAMDSACVSARRVCACVRVCVCACMRVCVCACVRAAGCTALLTALLTARPPDGLTCAAGQVRNRAIASRLLGITTEMVMRERAVRRGVASGQRGGACAALLARTRALPAQPPDTPIV